MGQPAVQAYHQARSRQQASNGGQIHTWHDLGTVHASDQQSGTLGFLFGANVDALSGGITMGMLLSVPVLIVGICLVWRSGREARV